MPQVQLRDRKVGHTMLAHAALGVSLAAIIVCSTSAARAGDDDEGGASVIGTIMRSIGMQDPNAHYAGIDYGERSPLVVPPNRDLPPPQTANATPAPNWPKDQDMERRAKARAEANKITPHRDYQSESSRPLTRAELDPANMPRAGAPAAGDGDSSADASMVDPRDRGAKKSLFSGIFRSKTEYATFAGEPKREALTDPPVGYLTPSPDQPYGVGEAPANYKVKTLGERVEPTR
jgi:hypothetical protein